jgi:hypothetical protein
MKKLLPLIVLGVLFVGSAASAAYFYNEYRTLKANPQATAQKEADALVAKIGALIVLPPDEKPTVATVQDPEKLKEQAFFANAKAGDKVLIYTTARKAILYNPDSNKIVEVAPVNIGDNPSTPGAGGTAGATTEGEAATQ